MCALVVESKAGWIYPGLARVVSSICPLIAWRRVPQEYYCYYLLFVRKQVGLQNA